MDVVEDFRAIRSEFYANSEKDNRQDFPRSRPNMLISKPRNNTLRPLSANATSFHTAPRAAPQPPGGIFSTKGGKIGDIVKPPHYLTFTQRQSQINLEKGIQESVYPFSNKAGMPVKERVTVLFTNGAPTLHMRFSMLDIPSPALIVEKVKSRPPSEIFVDDFRKSHIEARVSFALPPSTRSGTTISRPQDAEFPIPRPHFHDSEKTHSGSFRNSSLNSPVPSMNAYEIVTVPQRTFVQTAAPPRVLTTFGNNVITESPTSISPSTSNRLTFGVPSPIVPSPPRPQSSVFSAAQQATNSRVKSMSVKSIPDSIEAVHELAGQFPGPPVTFSSLPRPRSTVWEEGSDDNLSDPPGMVIAQAVGSPSQLTFSNTGPYPQSPAGTTLPTDDDSTTTWGNSQRSSLAIPPWQRHSHEVIPPVPVAYTERPIDPFDEDDDTAYQPPVLTSAMAKALRQSLGANVAKEVIKSMRMHSSNAPHSPDSLSPATAFSELTRFTPAGIQTGTPATVLDQFLDMGSALDTAKSRQFKPMQDSESVSPPLQKSPADEKLARIAEWVDTSASTDTAEIQVAEEQPNVTGNRSLQDLRERGKSIDQLAIPWLKDSATMEEEERKLALAMGGSKRPVITRLKSVGRVQQRSTPTPMHTSHARVSTHLEPIIIPPPMSNMPQIEQVEYGSLDSTSTGKGVLRDSEVLEMADMFASQNVNATKQSNYF